MSVTIIAEAGVNHNGSPDTALRLVKAAAAAGADVVKFQIFSADALATPEAPLAAYQARNDPDQTNQLEMLRALELPGESYSAILACCRECGIAFLATPFDTESLRFMVEKLGVASIKIGSGELTNGPLLFAAARTGRRIILSTGMATLDEVRASLQVLACGYAEAGQEPDGAHFQAAYEAEAGQRALREKVTLLHCTTEYPAPFDEINLRAMETLRGTFGLPVGLSDHSLGTAVPIAAAALGATVIEKHFTLDCGQPGPDHRASLDPSDFAGMARAVRQVEQALGACDKQPTVSEKKNVALARKSLVAARDIHRGERFTPDNITAKRPGSGTSPMRYWEWLGKTAARDYRKDEPL